MRQVMFAMITTEHGMQVTPPIVRRFVGQENQVRDELFKAMEDAGLTGCIVSILREEVRG